MTRDPLTRMDVDTRWPFHRKWRQLRLLYPADWPAFFAGWMALLGEAWSAGDRKLALEDAWLPDIPADLATAVEALVRVGLLDRYHRIPIRSWREWYEPVENRIRARSTAGRTAAEKRWNDRPERNAKGMRSQCTTPASQPRQPARARAKAPNGAPVAARDVEEGKKAWSKLGDVLHGAASATASEEAKPSV